jgi:hypothetical protein
MRFSISVFVHYQTASRILLYKFKVAYKNFDGLFQRPLKGCSVKEPVFRIRRIHNILGPSDPDPIGFIWDPHPSCFSTTTSNTNNKTFFYI